MSARVRTWRRAICTPPHPSGRPASAVLAALFVVGAGAATAQQRDAGSAKLVAITGVQSATVAPGGLAFASLAGTTQRQGTDEDDIDGSLALGVGLGSAEDAVGVQITYFATSLTDDFANSGSLAVKASRRVAAGASTTYVGLGIDDIAAYGDADDLDPRVTLSVTNFSRLTLGPAGDTYPLMLTLGAGSKLRNDRDDAALYAGAGIGLTPNIGISAAYTGEVVDIGSIFRIPGLDDFAFTAAVNDVFDDEDSRRMTFSVNYFLRDLF